METRFDLDGKSESLFLDMVSIQPQIGSTLLESYLALEDVEAVDGLGEFGAVDPRTRYYFNFWNFCY